MSAQRVSTFEMDGAGVRLLGRAAGLAAASLELPHGAYTTFRTYGGRGVVRLPQHLARLEESLALQGQPTSLDLSRARAAVAAALQATAHPESRVRVTFAPPRLFVSVERFVPLPARAYGEGVVCVTLSVRRDIPRAKDTRFIPTAISAYRQLPEGVEEGLLVGEDGAVLEGLSSNFFAVRDGVLRTEEERALLGITRTLVLEVADGLLPVERRAVHADELSHLAEAFITSVSRGVLPVVRIDGTPLGHGRVGPATRAIMARFADLARREAEPLD